MLGQNSRPSCFYASAANTHEPYLRTSFLWTFNAVPQNSELF